VTDEERAEAATKGREISALTEDDDGDGDDGQDDEDGDETQQVCAHPPGPQYPPCPHTIPFATRTIQFQGLTSRDSHPVASPAGNFESGAVLAADSLACFVDRRH
jgi:hypothetical protein